MEDVSSATQGVGQGDLGALLDDPSKFVENRSATEANINNGGEVSGFAPSGPTTSCSEFYTVRIASMMATRSEFETELEFQTTHSKVHWSELREETSEGASGSEDRGVDHRQYFEKLQKDATQGVGQGDLGALLDDPSKFVENRSATEANINNGGEVSGFAPSGPTTSCSEFYSVRIANMMATRSEFETELEFQRAHSKVHWSELSHPEGASGSEDRGVDHRQYFEKLQKDAQWGGFCNRVTNVVLGRKVGEGAQANIYEAQVLFAQEAWPLVSWEREYVVKLMKGDCALEDLQHQWPHGVGSLDFQDYVLPLHGALVKEPASGKSKFGFVMPRYWGDLRSLIDLRMEHKNAKGPPFSLLQSRRLMRIIARDMSILHESGIKHRDLKASNVLILHYKPYDIVSSNEPELIVPFVADWECSVGVVGTGWWRAPEILLQLKNRTPSSKLEFNEKVDVYSFAMTCYEITIGRTPFEGRLHCSKLCDAVLNGSRPELPHDLDIEIRAIITSCWDPNPSLRPTFAKLYRIMRHNH